MDRDGGPPRAAKRQYKMLIINEFKFLKSEKFPLLLGHFFAIIFSWKMPTGCRDVAAPETRIFFKVNGHDARKVHR
jgi:hypothetical protein